MKKCQNIRIIFTKITKSRKVHVQKQINAEWARTHTSFVILLSFFIIYMYVNIKIWQIVDSVLIVFS